MWSMLIALGVQRREQCQCGLLGRAFCFVLFWGVVVRVEMRNSRREQQKKVRVLYSNHFHFCCSWNAGSGVATTEIFAWVESCRTLTGRPRCLGSCWECLRREDAWLGLWSSEVSLACGTDGLISRWLKPRNRKYQERMKIIRSLFRKVLFCLKRFKLFLKDDKSFSLKTGFVKVDFMCW